MRKKTIKNLPNINIKINVGKDNKTKRKKRKGKMKLIHRKQIDTLPKGSPTIPLHGPSYMMPSYNIPNFNIPQPTNELSDKLNEKLSNIEQKLILYEKPKLTPEEESIENFNKSMYYFAVEQQKKLFDSSNAEGSTMPLYNQLNPNKNVNISNEPIIEYLEDEELEPDIGISSQDMNNLFETVPQIPLEQQLNKKVEPEEKQVKIQQKKKVNKSIKIIEPTEKELNIEFARTQGMADVNMTKDELIQLYINKFKKEPKKSLNKDDLVLSINQIK